MVGYTKLGEPFNLMMSIPATSSTKVIVISATPTNTNIDIERRRQIGFANFVSNLSEIGPILKHIEKSRSKSHA